MNFKRISKSEFLGRRYGAIAVVCLGLMLPIFLGCLQTKDFASAAAKPKPHSRQEANLNLDKSNTSAANKMTLANTKFGFKLFSEILKQDSKKNVFVSPSSIAIALAMTYNGASDKTQLEMAKALELQGMNLQEINQANNELKTTLEDPDSGVQMSIANSLWAKQGVPFNPNFLERNRQFYQAKITNLNFADPSAPDTINNWVKENTRGKINQIIANINDNDILFLINAIYFKGNWTTEFDKSQTTEHPFYLLNGTQKPHPMMSQTGKYRYLENEKFQAVSLPYGNERFSLYMFLPKQQTSLNSFYEQINSQNWEQWISQFRKRNGFIQVPRFKLEYDTELTPALKALGMKSAFGKANFTNMTSVPVNISQVRHKTFVEVNEEGTEAAAATSVLMTSTSLQMPEERFRMIVDRPFFCAIRDNQSGTVLFMGSIVEPK